MNNTKSNKAPNIMTGSLEKILKTTEYKAIQTEKKLNEAISKVDTNSINDEVTKTVITSALANINDMKIFTKHLDIIDEMIDKGEIDSSEVEKIKPQLQSVIKLSEENEKVKQENKEFTIEGALQVFQEKGLKSGFEFAKKTGKKTLKDSMNLTSILKGTLHTVGLATDSPALNILASEIGKQKDNSKEIETFSKLEDDINKAVKSPTKKDILASEIGKQKDNSKEIETFSKLEDDTLSSIEDNTELIYLKQDDFLVEVKKGNSLLSNMNNNISEMLFIQKDMRDDVQPISTKGQLISSTTGQKVPDEDEDLLDFDMFDKNKKKNRRGGRKSSAKGMKGMKGLLGKGMKALKFLGPIAAVAGTAYSAFEGFQQAEESFDLKKGETATAGQKTSSALGGIVSGATLGLVDTKSATQAIAKGSDFVSEHGIIGAARDFTTDDDSMSLAESLEDKGVVDLSVMGDSKVRNWEAVKKLDAKQIDALIRYDDWDNETLKALQNIEKAKSSNVNNSLKAVDGPDKKSPTILENNGMSLKTTNEQLSNMDKTQKTAKVAQQTKQEPIIVTVPQPSPSTTNEIDIYSIDDQNIVEQIRLRGLGV